MKLQFRIQKRFSLMVAIVACGACLWMIKERFFVSNEEMADFAIGVGIFLLVLIALAALVGFFVRWMSSRDDDISPPSGDSE